MLEIIGDEETYGYAITRRLNELGFTGVIEGTVYTILLRLERNGLVQVTKRPSEVGPPRKFYALNDAGRQELATFCRGQPYPNIPATATDPPRTTAGYGAWAAMIGGRCGGG